MSNTITDRQPVASLTANRGGEKTPQDGGDASPRDTFQAIDPNETGADVLRAAREMFKQPLEQTYQNTKEFIAEHPFFHHGLMEVPIGFGKHFRNVPFIGPYHVLHGIVSGDKTEIAKGKEVTRGTWDAA
jgi:hypothetical protein